MKIKQLSSKLWPLLLIGASSFAPLYSMELPLVKESLLRSLQRNKTPLLIGAGSLLAAGGAAYWYFKKPSNESIKAAIRKKTDPRILAEANHAKRGINVNVCLGTSPNAIADGKPFGSNPSPNDYYVLIITNYMPGNPKPIGIMALRGFACDNSKETKTITFEPDAKEYYTRVLEKDLKVYKNPSSSKVEEIL